MHVLCFHVHGPLCKFRAPITFNRGLEDADEFFKTHIFYLPFYFQAVKGTTAEQSGIRTIPYLGSIILSSIIVGGGITIIGWYKPFMIIGGAIFTVGAGMIYTLQISSGAAKWIGFQLLSGLGAGGGVQSRSSHKHDKSTSY